VPDAARSRCQTGWCRCSAITPLDTPGRAGLIFPNQVGNAAAAHLISYTCLAPHSCPRRAAWHCQQNQLNHGSGDQYSATWITDDGNTTIEIFCSYAQAVIHVARHAGEALRFHDLRHSYATWLVYDEVPPNMVQRVMGHEHVYTTLQLYVRRTDTTTGSAEHLLRLSRPLMIQMTTTALAYWFPSDEPDVP
jgi:hypothetical protein